MIRRREFTFLLGASPALARAATLPRSLEENAMVDEEIELIRVVHGLPSVSAAVFQRGGLRWIHASGLADRERAIEANTDTIYSLASVTKPLTAIAVMMLAERGSIDLDAPANDYLGGALIRSPMGQSDRATVRRLLNHTSGMPRFYSLVYADQNRPRRSMDEVIERFGKTMIEPGSILLYSNLGFGILERVIERVSNLSYPAFLQREIFDPLGICRGFIATGPDLPDNVAARYMASGARVPFYDSEHRGAAGAFMAPADLARFGQFLLAASRGTSPLLSASSAQSMLIDHAGFQDPTDYYGLGLDISHRGGVLTFGHSGSMPGVAAELLVVPDSDLIVALAINQAHSTARRAMIDALLVRFGDIHPIPAIPPSLNGRWHGKIDLLDEGQLPLTLELGVGRPYALLGSKRVAIIRIVDGRGGYFNIDLAEARLLARDASPTRHRIQFKLRRKGNSLEGYTVTEGQMQRDRDGLDFPYWTHLLAS